MAPFDPSSSDLRDIQVIQGKTASAASQDKSKNKTRNIATAAAGDDALPPCWQGASPQELLLYGPLSARFDEPPPPNPEPPDPDEDVGEELTPRQLAFCERYVECPVAKYAARDAGYSESTAATQASRLLKHPRVMRRILELRRKWHLEHAYRRETLMDKLEVVFGEAIGRREFYAAIQALTMQARLAGLAGAIGDVRHPRAGGTGREQAIWDAVGRLEQKLSEIALGVFAGAAGAKPGETKPDDVGESRSMSVDVGRSGGRGGARAPRP